jgi:hypothetical protein
MTHISSRNTHDTDWEAAMNDKKTDVVSQEDLQRSFREAVNNLPIMSTNKEYKILESLKDMKISILPPLKEGIGTHHKLYGKTQIQATLQHMDRIKQANDILMGVGFLEEQVDAIRKAIAKELPDKVAKYKQQFVALYNHNVGGFPIPCEEQWHKVCELFGEPNPLGQPKEYFHFYDEGSFYMTEATEARKKKILEEIGRIADLVDFPTPVTVKTVKPTLYPPPMGVMHSVSEGIHPVKQEFYLRTMPNPATLEYMDMLRSGKIEEKNTYNVGDMVEVLEGEHKGKAGQIVQFMTNGPTSIAWRVRLFSIKLAFWDGNDVTCQECQVTKLPTAKDFQKNDRVRVRFGANAGREGKVVNVAACGFMGSQPVVFVLFNKEESPTGFEPFKLGIMERPERTASKYDILAEPVIQGQNLPNHDTMLEKQDWNNLTPRKLNGVEIMQREMAIGNYDRVVTVSREHFEQIQRSSIYAPLVQRFSVRHLGAPTFHTEFHPLKSMKTVENYPADSTQRVMTLRDDLPKIPLEKVFEIIEGTPEQTVGRANRADQQTIIVDMIGYGEKEIVRPGPVTVDTRGFDPKGSTVEILGKCICDMKVLMTAGCKCGQPVQSKPEAKEEECTCPLDVIMTAGCKCGSIKK